MPSGRSPNRLDARQAAFAAPGGETQGRGAKALDRASSRFERLALIASEDDKAQDACRLLAEQRDWTPLESADAVVVIGGDGFLLQTLHAMLDRNRVIPAYGVNCGTVGFLMNPYRDPQKLLRRIERAREVAIDPLVMQATDSSGKVHRVCAINEVSMLRETRQTAKIEIEVDGRKRLGELVCDGVLLATPAGSTAYNLSANGPILPLGSKLLALTPISAFRPRRWRGAILPDSSKVRFRVLEPVKRPVSAVADQKEVRDVADIVVEIAKELELTLLFDPGQALDERIVAEQFLV